jgi:hypothetical protein
MASYAYTFTSGDTVTPTKLNNARTVSEIVNADVGATAAIAGTKIAPNFGSQNVVTGANVTLSGGGSEDRSIHIGASRSASGFAYIDLQGDTTYANGLRIIRGNSGPNTVSNIEHRGTGPLQFVTQEAAPLVLWTNATERMRIDAIGNVGLSNTSPNAAAILDCNSTSKGFLPPRMSTAQRDAISTPPAGLMIYNNSTNVLNFYNGSAWGAV